MAQNSPSTTMMGSLFSIRILKPCQAKPDQVRTFKGGHFRVHDRPINGDHLRDLLDAHARLGNFSVLAPADNDKVSSKRIGKVLERAIV
jgi:hypothetical protein